MMGTSHPGYSGRQFLASHLDLTPARGQAWGFVMVVCVCCAYKLLELCILGDSIVCYAPLATLYLSSCNVFSHCWHLGCFCIAIYDLKGLAIWFGADLFSSLYNYLSFESLSPLGYY